MDLDAAIGLLDATAVMLTETERYAWRVVRAAARRGRRISSTTLPAMGEAAQHAAAARDHAQKSLDALGGAVGARPGETDPEDER